MSRQKIGGSFRDPSGTVYHDRDGIYRRIHEVYKSEYQHLMKSGLYKNLVEKQLLIPHKEVSTTGDAFKTIKPVQIPFVSYPYEWCFSQLKDAAQTTLKIQETALQFGMTLKDANAFNIQFYKGKPTLIDTLSFRIYEEGQSWEAYRQFCMQFLAPLLLMAKVNPQLNKMLRVYIDGIPLPVASSLLPALSWLNPSVLTHIHIHSKMQESLGYKKITVKKHPMGKVALLGLIDNLKNLIQGLNLKNIKTEWSDYYQDNSYSEKSLNHKKQIVEKMIKKISPVSVWDIGANTGEFSHIASDLGSYTISFDSDFLAVEKNYLFCKAKSITNCLPLVLDITNPSPSLGWEHEERMSLIQRSPADLILFLALLHHLVITHNVPMEKIASFLSKVCRTLIIEFIPKEDVQVQRLLTNRRDIFTDYNQENFEKEFGKYFTLTDKIKLKDTDRRIYLMKKK